MKSSHHLSHDRASKGHGSIPCLMSQTDLHRIKGRRTLADSLSADKKSSLVG